MTIKQAVESILSNHSNHALCLNGSGNAVRERFTHIELVDDISRAIVTVKQTVELIPYNVMIKPLSAGPYLSA